MNRWSFEGENGGENSAPNPGRGIVTCHASTWGLCSGELLSAVRLRACVLQVYIFFDVF
jgi:hypothetical protein